jgi:2-C-methyl-D-erythritol 4-phosphate cytidylyltransferase
VPVLPVADTVKEVTGTGSCDAGPRAALRAVQTPQGFRGRVLERARRSGCRRCTDDAGLVEALGGTVTTVAGLRGGVQGDPPLDLLLAEAVLARAA